LMKKKRRGPKSHVSVPLKIVASKNYSGPKIVPIL
jgi:hypothetical protein